MTLSMVDLARGHLQPAIAPRYVTAMTSFHIR